VENKCNIGGWMTSIKTKTEEKSLFKISLTFNIF